jgi:hypothetical protein
MFTWVWHSTPERESLVTVSLSQDGDDTRDGHQTGWTSTLERLERMLGCRQHRKALPA